VVLPDDRGRMTEDRGKKQIEQAVG
jgi:hypothetical protein